MSGEKNGGVSETYEEEKEQRNEKRKEKINGDEIRE